MSSLIAVLSIAIDRIGAGGVSGSADGNLMFFFLDYQEVFLSFELLCVTIIMFSLREIC
jgi:hypothetical protein